MRKLYVIVAACFIQTPFMYGKPLPQNMIITKPSSSSVRNKQALHKSDAPDALPINPSTWMVNLQGTQLKAITTKTFKDPKYKSVRWLNLRYKNISEIEPGSFKHLPNLRVLLLDNNQLTSFKPGTFKGLKGLKVVTLYGNPNDELLKQQTQREVPHAIVTTRQVTKQFIKWSLGIVGIAAVIVGAGVAIASGKKAQLSKKPHETEKADAGAESLFNAVQDNDIHKIEKLLGQGIHVDAQNENGMTALMQAVLDKKGTIVELLLKEGADPNISTIYGRTVLMFAAENGYHNIVKKLVEKGADIMKKDHDGKTAADYAFEKNEDEKGTDIVKRDHDGKTAADIFEKNKDEVYLYLTGIEETQASIQPPEPPRRTRKTNP